MDKQFRNVVKNKIMESFPQSHIGRPQKIDLDETLDLLFKINAGKLKEHDFFYHYIRVADGLGISTEAVRNVYIKSRFPVD